MKTCPKCGYDKLADTARFCHKCGCDCAAVQVKRTPAAEEPEAAPLVGDKNLINESTIIGKQEKYEASNITIHNNITEDHSHTTIVCAVSGKRIYLDHSVVCPKCGKQVALEYYVEASKRCENCEQQAREEYRAFVVRTTGAGPLDAACKQQLDAEAQRLQIDAATQASILRARQQKPAGKSAELTSVQRAELEAFDKENEEMWLEQVEERRRSPNRRRKASKPSPCCTRIRRTTRPATGISSRGRSSARRSR